MSKKIENKVTAPKPAKVAKQNVELVSFSVTAVIPTMSYGNIQPTIQVTAPSIEEARATVMPVIEDLFKTYSEGKPAFLGKITVTEKVVGTTVPVTPEVAQRIVETSPVVETSPAAPVEKPASVAKAEKAIAAATKEGLGAIMAQITASVKIPDEFKNGLLNMAMEKMDTVQ